METTAVYWEPKIKIYGFDVVKDLSFVLPVFRKEGAASWGGCISELEKSDLHFIVVLMRPLGDRSFRMGILVKSKEEESLLRGLGGPHFSDGSMDVVSPVGLITFQGPHFGDRPGIAHAALRALKSADVPLLGSVCSVAHISLILPEHKAEEALLALKAVFQVPPKQINRLKRLSGER